MPSQPENNTRLLSLDEAAVNYKQTAITEASDTEKIVKLQQLQDELDEIAEIDSIRATELFD